MHSRPRRRRADPGRPGLRARSVESQIRLPDPADRGVGSTRGGDARFVKAPQSATAEDQLLVQFQGMIAEYERAQILERSRRGKRHHARQGHINVLCGAPYGYRYVRKTQDTAAYYEIIEEQAVVVRKVYGWYTVAGLSIAAITRRLN